MMPKLDSWPANNGKIKSLALPQSLQTTQSQKDLGGLTRNGASKPATKQNQAGRQVLGGL